MYQPTASLKLDVLVDKDTVWLGQEQIAELFGTKRPAITKHLVNIFAIGELQEDSVCSILEHTASDGKTYKKKFYNLDAILSIGYRVNTVNATIFRKRATAILKDYMFKGIAIHKRIEHLEQHAILTDKFMNETKTQLDFFIENALPRQSGVFFDGEVFDAHMFVIDLVKLAKNRIILIDNYVDENVLTILSQRANGVKATIYTEKIENTFQLALTKYNAQYPNVDVKVVQNFHDRFLIIDEQIYHIGASIKDLGKKVFAFSKLGLETEIILARLSKEH